MYNLPHSVCRKLTSSLGQKPRLSLTFWKSRGRKEEEEWIFWNCRQFADCAPCGNKNERLFTWYSLLPQSVTLFAPQYIARLRVKKAFSTCIACRNYHDGVIYETSNQLPHWDCTWWNDREEQTLIWATFLVQSVANLAPRWRENEPFWVDGRRNEDEEFFYYKQYKK